MPAAYQQLLTESPLVVIDIEGFAPPYTVSLASAAADRAIKLSVDGGASWFDPELDVETDSCIAVVIGTRISAVQFIGAVGDVARIIAN